MPTDVTASPCQSCGACCAHSRDWPRFTLEDDAEIARIPRYLRDDRGAGMRCDGDRCAALAGEIGNATACSIYEFRPAVCRECQPGDEECVIARRGHGLAPLDACTGAEPVPVPPPSASGRRGDDETARRVDQT